MNEGVPPPRTGAPSQFMDRGQGWCGVSCLAGGTLSRPPSVRRWVRVEGRGIFVYPSPEELQRPLHSVPDALGAEILTGRTANDSDPNLQADGGDEPLNAELECQIAGKGEFHRFAVEVTDDGRMIFRETDAGIVSSVNLIDPITGSKMRVRGPKTHRECRRRRRTSSVPTCSLCTLAC